jgi:hypothetical protein
MSLSRAQPNPAIAPKFAIRRSSVGHASAGLAILSPNLLGNPFRQEDAMRKNLCLIAAACFASLSVLAAPHCDPATTKGVWEYTCDGYLTPPPPAPAALAPARLLGTCNASSSAYWSCTGTVNLGGTILDQELQGQANNNADCTGTITYAQKIFGQPAPDLNIRYVIWDQGARISGLPVDAGQVLSCRLHRIHVSGNP